jgi:hypothetical protein
MSDHSQRLVFIAAYDPRAAGARLIKNRQKPTRPRVRPCVNLGDQLAILRDGHFDWLLSRWAYLHMRAPPNRMKR